MPVGQIGNFHLWWYGLSYTLVFLALFHGFRTVREPLGLDVPQVYGLTILIAAGVLIGGRAVEVIFYEWAYHSQHLSRIFLDMPSGPSGKFCNAQPRHKHCGQGAVRREWP